MIFCSFLQSLRFCAMHLYAPSSKDVQTIGELTNSQWKWLRLLKLHKRSFYSAAIDKKTVEKLLLLSFCCGVIQTHTCSCSFFIHYIIIRSGEAISLYHNRTPPAPTLS